MARIWIKPLAVLFAAITLAGCATSKDQVLPHDAASMQDIWNGQTGGTSSGPGNATLREARLTLRRPLLAAPPVTAAIAYTRTAQNEITRQFTRLPNPDLVMYVYPHLSGSEPTPVPGYSTVFPFYQRVQYALPGERTEDY